MLVVNVGAPAASQDQYVHLPGFQCVGGKFGLHLPKSYSKLERMAQIRSEHIELIEEEQGFTVTRKDVLFSGLTLGVVTASNKPNAFLVSGAEINSSNWNRISPFKVGQLARSAQRQLGSRAAHHATLNRTYGTESSSLSFAVQDGRITQIRYACYTG